MFSFCLPMDVYKKLDTGLHWQVGKSKACLYRNDETCYGMQMPAYVTGFTLSIQILNGLR